MALSQSVEESLKEAEQSLRNALAYAARQERPMVCSVIADLISRIESVMTTDSLPSVKVIFTRTRNTYRCSRAYQPMSSS